jgi:hypothetical protein
MVGLWENNSCRRMKSTSNIEDPENGNMTRREKVVALFIYD